MHYVSRRSPRGCAEQLKPPPQEHSMTDDNDTPEAEISSAPSPATVTARGRAWVSLHRRAVTSLGGLAVVAGLAVVVGGAPSQAELPEASAPTITAPGDATEGTAPLAPLPEAVVAGIVETTVATPPVSSPVTAGVPAGSSVTSAGPASAGTPT